VKRFCFVISIFFLSACSIFKTQLPYSNIPFEIKSKNNSLSGWSFVIDAGHGGAERGAAANIPFASAEADLNLGVSLTLGGILEACGANVFYTRKADFSFNQTESSLTDELRSRADFSNEHAPQFFISIHHNASKGPRKNRVELYYKLFTKGPARELSISILKELSKLYPNHDTALRSGNFAVLRENQGEAILVECTYLSDPLLSSQLETFKLLKHEAEAIAMGIINYAKYSSPQAVQFDTSVETVSDSALDFLIVVKGKTDSMIEAGEKFRIIEYMDDEEELLRRIERYRPKTVFILFESANEKIEHYYRSNKGKEIAESMKVLLSGTTVAGTSNYLLSQTSAVCLMISTAKVNRIVEAIVKSDEW